MKGRYRYGSVLWVLIFMQQKRGEILACKHYLLFSSSYDYFSILFWGSTRLTADLSQKYSKNSLSIRILEAGINFVQVLNFLTAVTEDLECAWRPSSRDKFSSLFWLFCAVSVIKKWFWREIGSGTAKVSLHRTLSNLDQETKSELKDHLLMRKVLRLGSRTIGFI